MVADEIRELAEDSHRSTDKIASILQDIKAKTGQVTEQINIGHDAVLSSKNSTEEVKRVFKEIDDNTKNVVEQAQYLEESVRGLEKESQAIVEEISSISSIIEETSASVEEVLAGSEEQTNKVKNIVESFKQLDKLINKLQSLTKGGS